MNYKIQTPEPDFLQNGWTSKLIVETEFPEPVYVIEGIIPEGTSLLVAPVKIGKSWMALDMANTTATGGLILGDIPVEPGKVLILALEDTPRRLKNRILKQQIPPSENCFIFTQWATGQDGVLWIMQFIEKYPDIKLIIIDTLQRFAGIQDTNDYGETTEVLAGIKRIADDFNVSIILLHHTKKQQQDDFTHQVLGSTGIVGAVDTIVSLTRKRGEVDAVMNITGRDVEEKSLALKFDKTVCRWEIVGDAAEVMDTKERQEIIDLLKEQSEPIGPKAIADMLGKPVANIKMLLYKMVRDNQIIKENRGKYKVINGYHDYHGYLDNNDNNGDLFD